MTTPTWLSKGLWTCLVSVMVTGPGSLAGQGLINKVGTATALFLKIPVGAKAVATGGAGITQYGNTSAVFANPASLALAGDQKSVDISYTQWLLGIHHQAIAYVQPMGRDTYLGVNIVSLVSSAMEVTTTLEQNGTGDFFRYQDAAVGITAARRFSDRLAMGLTAKIVMESAYTVHAIGYAVDFGTWYWVGLRDIRLTMALRNFGPEIQYNGTFEDTHVKGNLRRTDEYDYGSFPLPLTFALGVAGNLVEKENYTVELHLETQHLNDYTPRVNAGLRWVSRTSLWLAAGMKFNYEQESFSAGLGFDGNRFSFGYGYQPMQYFSDVQTLSFTLKL